MKMRPARGGAGEDRSLDLTDVVEFPIDQGLAEMRGRFAIFCRLAGDRVHLAHRHTRQIPDVEATRSFVHCCAFLRENAGKSPASDVPLL
jgi:hypothetical protein